MKDFMEGTMVIRKVSIMRNYSVNHVVLAMSGMGNNIERRRKMFP